MGGVLREDGLKLSPTIAQKQSKNSKKIAFNVLMTELLIYVSWKLRLEKINQTIISKPSKWNMLKWPAVAHSVYKSAKFIAKSRNSVATKQVNTCIHMQDRTNNKAVPNCVGPTHIARNAFEWTCVHAVCVGHTANSTLQRQFKGQLRGSVLAVHRSKKWWTFQNA